MTTLNDKEKAAENKYAHDQETEFKIRVRRNKLFALWAAEKMGLSAAVAEEYAEAAAMGEIGKSGEETLFNRVKNDFASKGIEISDNDIHAQMKHMLESLRTQFS